MNFLKYFAGLCCIFAAYSTFAQYVTVVDAGSSGSKVYIYKLTDGQVKAITPSGVKKITPGLEHIGTNSASIQAYADALLADTKLAVDEGKTIPVADMSVYVYATAGMRLINPVLANSIYKAINKDLLADGFASVSVKTIPGKMEGVYDWIALNYLKGTLSKGVKHTFGVLDMGGASTEIAFAATKFTPSNKNRFDFSVGKHDYQLYTRSYLGLGQDMLRAQYTNNKNCFPKGYTLPNTHKATGRFKKCVKQIKPIITKVHHVSLPVSLAAKRFYLMSGFYYTATSKPFGFAPGKMRLSAYAQAGKSFCAEKWDNLVAQYPDDHYLYGYCVGSAYHVALLRHGYHFGRHKPAVFHVANSINGTTIDWTLGVAVLLAQSAQ